MGIEKDSGFIVNHAGSDGATQYDMNHSGTVQNPRKPVKKWRSVNIRSVKGPLLVLAALLGIFEHRLHWGRAPIAAAVAMVLPIIAFREWWTEARFWITIVLLGLVQVALVIEVRALMEQLKFPFMLAFGIFDCVMVITVVSRVCLAGNGEGK